MKDEMMTTETMFTLPDSGFGEEEPSPFNAPIVDVDAFVPTIPLDAPPTDSYCIDENGSLPRVISPISKIGDISIIDNVNKHGIRRQESPPPETASSPMSEWNDQWIITLKDRKENEESLKLQTIEAAKADIIRFQTDQEVKRIAKMEQNRTEEQETLVVIDADLEAKNPWNNVVKLVELTQDNIEHSLDCGRMRDILITLKNND